MGSGFCWVERDPHRRQSGELDLLFLRWWLVLPEIPRSA